MVHSDKGAHFASAWWQTLCALMGVRVSYGQAYHHQDKGRVEVAGQQILGKLKTLILDLTEEGVSWVELLPKALRQIHDTPGETGFSPYEIVFGRHRSYSPLPFQPVLEAPGAVEFIEKMRAQDVLVAKKLQEVHEKRMAQVNFHRKELPPFEVGAKVWYQPEKSQVPTV